MASTGFEPTAFVLALHAVFYQLSYEDPYIWSRPICWVFNVQKKWHADQMMMWTMEIEIIDSN